MPLCCKRRRCFAASFESSPLRCFRLPPPQARQVPPRGKSSRTGKPITTIKTSRRGCALFVGHVFIVLCFQRNKASEDLLQHMQRQPAETSRRAMFCARASEDGMMQSTLRRVSYRALVLVCVGISAGCAIGPKDFGYVQLWCDRNSYGDSAMFFERVRTDGSNRPRLAVTYQPSTQPLPVPTEQSKSPKPADSGADSVAEAMTPEGVWLFH